MAAVDLGELAAVVRRLRLPSEPIDEIVMLVEHDYAEMVDVDLANRIWQLTRH